MRRTAGTLLAAGLLPNDLYAASGVDFDFIAVNDLHFSDPKLCSPWFEAAFSAMREGAPKAEFLIAGGDLTDDGTAEQFAGIKEMFSLLEIPVFATPGNHDVSADGGRRDVYEQFFPGTTNYAFERGGWQFISVNSAESRGYKDTSVPSETLRWLDDNLKKFDKKTPTIVSTHFPLGDGMTYRPKNADDLLERFKELNVRHIFNGHWHGYREVPFQEGFITTDRCCSRLRNNADGSPAKGWFHCQIRDGKLSRTFVSAPAELLGKADAKS